MSPKLTKVMGLPTCRAGIPVHVWFAKDEMHQTKEVVLHVTLKDGTLLFVENLVLCKMDEVDFNLGDTSLKTHMVDGRHTPMCFLVCCGRL